MNQDKTIISYDESIAIDAELLPREKNEKERKEKKSYHCDLHQSCCQLMHRRLRKGHDRY